MAKSIPLSSFQKPYIIMAIDPGPVNSGVVILDMRTNPPKILDAFSKYNSASLAKEIMNFTFGRECSHVIIEMVASYGMAVGDDIFETCVYIGRFLQANDRLGRHTERMTRLEVKISICRNAKASDPNVRQAIIDLYPASGGGKTPQIGTKNNPGPLYGLAEDAWAALALGIAWGRKHGILSLI